MMCYRDMTFCNFKECKKFSECERAFTEEIRNGSIKWWGSENAPIALFSERPDCYENKVSTLKEGD